MGREASYTKFIPRVWKFKNERIIKMELTIHNSAIAQFTNAKLNQATKKVFTIGSRIEKNYFELASIMADVEESKCYESDGFSSASDWAMQTFGFKKSLSYSLLRIGSEYVDRANKCSNLPHRTVSDYSVSQLTALIPIGHEMASELSESGEISPDMTVRELKAFVKSARKSNNEKVVSEIEDVPEIEDEQLKLREYVCQDIRKSIVELYDAICEENYENPKEVWKEAIMAIVEEIYENLNAE